MVEIPRGVVGHADLPHDALGGQVGLCREGQDLGGVEVGEAPGQRRRGAFAGQALAPGFRDQPPAHLDGGPHRQVAGLDRRQAHEADQPAIGLPLGAPEAEAVGGDVGVDAVHHRVALGPVLGPGQPGAHPRIAVEDGEGFAVVLPVGPQDQAPGLDHPAGRGWTRAP